MLGAEWDLSLQDLAAPGIYRVADASVSGLVEASGLVLSRNRPDVFWTHNDGSRPTLYAMNGDGVRIQTVAVTGFSPTDFEDIATDSDGNLYLADTGDNREQRQTVTVVRVREPAAGELTAAVTAVWTLRWPSGARDAESLFIHGGHGWLIGKIRGIGETSPLMRFPLAATNGLTTLEFVGDLAIDSPAAGADITADGRKLTVLSRAAAYVWTVAGDPARSVITAPARVDFDLGFQNEGITFVPQGALVIAESNARHLLSGGYFLNVPGPLRIRSFRITDAGLELRWDGVQGRCYTFERRASLNTGTWESAAANVPGQGTDTVTTLPVNPVAATATFLRIRE
jgi:hypothetical protein